MQLVAVGASLHYFLPNLTFFWLFHICSTFIKLFLPHWTLRHPHLQKSINLGFLTLGRESLHVAVLQTIYAGYKKKHMLKHTVQVALYRSIHKNICFHEHAMQYSKLCVNSYKDSF